MTEQTDVTPPTPANTARLFTGFEKELLERALEAWGRDAQEVHAIEELSELTTALTQHVRGRADDDEVVDEIADVLIVANQLALIYGEAEVESRIDYKINRLNERVNDAL